MKLRPSVLMYHGFADGVREYDPFAMFVSADALEAQLTFLLRSGRRPLDLDAYIATRQRPRRPSRSFLITIDDGFESVADIAAPILRRFGVPAVLFVPPAKIGGHSDWMTELPDEPILTAERLRDLRASGVELGVHGLDHRDLVGLDDRELRRQTVEARDLMADMTGIRPRSFAYPRGAHDERARAAVRGAGFDVAFTVFGGRGDHAVPRIDIAAVDTMRTVRMKMVPGYRSIWRAAGHAPTARRLARRLVTRSAGSS